MNKKAEQAYTIPVVLVVLTILFVLFIVLIYPSERAELLSDTEGGAYSIKITNDGFAPSTLEVSVNSRVSWVNVDNSKHTITFLDSESNSILPGGGYSKQFSETGSYTYTSDFNPGFKGTIKVT